MFELLMNPSSGKYISDSGPGPKTMVAGNTAAGFFGFVTDEELGDIGERIWTSIGRTPSYVATKAYQNRGVIWSKVMVDGEVYFIPNMPIVSNVPIRSVFEAGIFSRIPKKLYYGNNSTPANLVSRQGRIYGVREGRALHAVSVAAPAATTNPPRDAWKDVVLSEDPEVRAMYIAFGAVNVSAITEKAFVRHSSIYTSFTVLFGNVSWPGSVMDEDIYGIQSDYAYYNFLTKPTPVSASLRIQLTSSPATFASETISYLPVVKLERGVVDIPLDEIYPIKHTLTTSFSAQSAEEVAAEYIEAANVTNITADSDSITVHSFDVTSSAPELAIVDSTYADVESGLNKPVDAAPSAVTGTNVINSEVSETLTVGDGGYFKVYGSNIDSAGIRADALVVNSSAALRLVKPFEVKAEALSAPVIVFEKV